VRSAARECRRCHRRRRARSAGSACPGSSARTPRMRKKAGPAGFSSVDLRFGDRSSTLEEVEIAALVGLLHMLGEDRTVAGVVFARRGFPGALALLHLCIGDLQVQLALVDVEL